LIVNCSSRNCSDCAGQLAQFNRAQFAFANRMAVGETCSSQQIRIWQSSFMEAPPPPIYNEQKLKLGLFDTNCSNGLTITHALTSSGLPAW
jgi:hypothetical protein